MIEGLFFCISLLGICIGSFLNVLIDRLPRKETILRGRSHCDSCKKVLSWKDLIPVFSFLFLRGKCRGCKSSIGLRTPLVELLTGFLFVITLYTLAFQTITILSIITLLFYLFIISVLLVIFFCDIYYGIIPNAVLYPAFFVTVIFTLITKPHLFLSYLLCSLAAGGFFFLLFLITRGRGMGFGDVKYAFFLGFLLGFPQVIVALYIAFLTGAIIASILVLWRKKKFVGGTIPFGPFLVLGTIASLYGGNMLLGKILAFLSLR